MPLVWTIHVQRQNGNTQIYTYIKIIPVEQADSECGVRLPGEKSWWKKILLLPMALRHFLGHGLPCLRPPIASMSCRCTPFFFVLNNFAVSIRTSFHLVLSFPAGLLHLRHHSIIRLEILLSIVPITGQSTSVFPQACRKEVLDSNTKSLEVWKDVRARVSTL